MTKEFALAQSRFAGGLLPDLSVEVFSFDSKEPPHPDPLPRRGEGTSIRGVIHILTSPLILRKSHEMKDIG